MKEIWKPVVGFETTHQVSNLGRVKSLPRKYVKKEKIIKQTITRGYCTFSLNKDAVQVGKLVHRLVAEAFIPNPENKPEVNHKDLDKTNNKASNLEWCTKIENMQHAIRLGVVPVMNGEKNGSSKLKEKQVIYIKNSKLKLKELAKMFNVSMSNISEIRRNETWKHV